MLAPTMVMVIVVLVVVWTLVLVMMVVVVMRLIALLCVLIGVSTAHIVDLTVNILHYVV